MSAIVNFNIILLKWRGQGDGKCQFAFNWHRSRLCGTCRVFDLVYFSNLRELRGTLISLRDILARFGMYLSHDARSVATKFNIYPLNALSPWHRHFKG